MPLSDRRFDKQIEQFIKNNPAKDYLDIGTGAGKYGKIIRKHIKDANIIGIEANLDYIQKYQLKSIYTQIINQNIEQFIVKNPGFKTDIVTMGNLIEHLFKSDGLNLLHYLIYRSKFIILVFPTKFIQYDIKGYSSEAHRSIWDETDFKQFDYQYKKIDFMNMVIIKGYLQDPQVIISNLK